MTTVTKPVTYTGTMQRLVVPPELAGSVTVDLWGGGGGGGGNDSGIGGNGSGAGYARKTFSVVAGDVIDVAVGGSGGAGASSVRGYGGGAAGSSYRFDTLVFNSLNPPSGQPPVYQVTNRVYASFLNQYGVWGEPGGYTGSFSRTYTFTAPVSGTYQIVSSCDNFGYVYIDGNQVLVAGDYTRVYETNITLSAGAHTITTLGYNTGGPGSMATTVSLVDEAFFNLRTAVGTWGGIAAPAGATGWYSWMNSNAVEIPTSPWTYSVNFPQTADYIWLLGADYGMTVKIDGSTVASITDYAGSYNAPSPVETVYPVSAGTHTVEIIPSDDGGTVGYALNIQQDVTISYSGAFGGNAGPVGFSGGGGGGGGSTVVFLNGTVIAVAGGGGGGGGAGNRANRNGGNAPGSAGRALATTTNGQNGGNNVQDGGGGGGGGGGYGGGNGGIPVYYDQGGTAGSAGGNLGDVVAEPVNQNPGVASAYGAVGQGGSYTRNGTNGLAAFTFNAAVGPYVKDGGSWQQVQQTYVKNNNVWSPVQEIYIKQNGQWQLIAGSTAPPTFQSLGNSNFGVAARPTSV